MYLRTHTGDKPFKCTKCDYAWSGTGSMKIHIRTHTEEILSYFFRFLSPFYESTHHFLLVYRSHSPRLSVSSLLTLASITNFQNQIFNIFRGPEQRSLSDTITVHIHTDTALSSSNSSPPVEGNQNPEFVMNQMAPRDIKAIMMNLEFVMNLE